MKKCIVIGGGIAGLTAASYLVKNGIKVTLLESSPKPGGRAYSFKLPDKNQSIDNGQHVLMGCYRDTLSFLKLIGAQRNFIYQKKLDVNLINSDKQIIKLKSAAGIYPINLLIGFMSYKALSFKERLNVLKFMLKLPFTSEKKLFNKNIFDWLQEENQSENTIRSLWELIAVGALNTNIKQASALIFKNILMKIFFGGNKAAAFILPKFGLTESYVNNAANYIKNNGGKIILSERAEKLVISNKIVTEILTPKNKYSDFDFVISAVPSYSLQKIISPEYIIGKVDFQYSSILNVHIWLKENKFSEDFYGLLNSNLHWIFNKGTHINLVISDADYLMDKSEEEIIEMCMLGLNKYGGIDKDKVVDYKILKEKRATFIPSVSSVYTRPSAKTGINNLFLAGDFTDTGLPSTIESAAKSGRVASDLVLNKI